MDSCPKTIISLDESSDNKIFKLIGGNLDVGSNLKKKNGFIFLSQKLKLNKNQIWKKNGPAWMGNGTSSYR